VALIVSGSASPPIAHADQVAYLVNVTVRPGYNFASADDALAHGQRICEYVSSGRSYRGVVNAVATDLHDPDENQATYLITQAVGELCPGEIWQLRRSAAGYRQGLP
jgi:hypothetical protein